MALLTNASAQVQAWLFQLGAGNSSEIPADCRQWILLGGICFDTFPGSFWLLVVRHRQPLELWEVSLKTPPLATRPILGNGYFVPSLVRTFSKVSELGEVAFLQFVQSLMEQANWSEIEVDQANCLGLLSELFETERRQLELRFNPNIAEVLQEAARVSTN